MTDITEMLQERIRKPGLDIDELEEQENSAQDREWVFVDAAQISQSATPQPLESGGDPSGKPEMKTEADQRTASDTDKTQPDVIQNVKAEDRDEEQFEEMRFSESATPSLMDSGVDPSKVQSPKETMKIEDETYINSAGTGATQQEQSMSQRSDFSPFDDIPYPGNTPPPQYDQVLPENLITLDDDPQTKPPDAPKPEPKPDNEVLLRYNFKITFELGDDQFRQVREKLMEEIFDSDIWQTWEYISEEDRAFQFVAFRCDLLFRDYRQGHCLNNESFRDPKTMVNFDSYLEQLIESCCRQWSAVEDGDRKSEDARKVLGSEVLTQEMAEDICRNFKLVEQI